MATFKMNSSLLIPQFKYLQHELLFFVRCLSCFQYYLKKVSPKKYILQMAHLVFKKVFSLYFATVFPSKKKEMVSKYTKLFWRLLANKKDISFPEKKLKNFNIWFDFLYLEVNIFCPQNSLWNISWTNIRNTLQVRRYSLSQE